jgi:hypothetical protein
VIDAKSCIRNGLQEIARDSKDRLRSNRKVLEVCDFDQSRQTSKPDGIWLSETIGEKIDAARRRYETGLAAGDAAT